MTEEEWLTSVLPHELIGSFRQGCGANPPKRKLRIYLCGCWRYLLGDATPVELPPQLVLTEKLADGHLSPDEAKLVRRSVMAGSMVRNGSPDNLLAMAVLFRHAELWDSILRFTALVIQLRLAAELPDRYQPVGAGEWRMSRDAERSHLAHLFRDIFGNPFRPVVFDPRWRTSDTVGVARGIYEDWAFERMPILADALMDAGCDDESILTHCWGDGPHVRGCWVVDLILDKR